MNFWRYSRRVAVTATAGANRPQGTVPQAPPPRPREIRCVYCGAIVTHAACANCGAPR